jgi:hypothetical protein
MVGVVLLAGVATGVVSLSGATTPTKSQVASFGAGDTTISKADCERPASHAGFRILIAGAGDAGGTVLGAVSRAAAVEAQHWRDRALACGATVYDPRDAEIGARNPKVSWAS